LHNDDAMSDPKRCIRCERAIDAYASVCPYCNWNQSTPPPVREVVPVEVAEYKPPEERNAKQKLIYAGIGVVILILAFVGGVIINRDGTPKNVPQVVDESSNNTPVSMPRRADTQLIPTNEPGGIEQPITSAPASGPVPGMPANEWDRSDATAVSSAEYAQLARRAMAEKKPQQPLVDPRSLTGAAYAQEPHRRPIANRVAAAGARTRPVPEYQGLPPIHAQGAAILDLTVGPNGRVTDIAVRRAPFGGMGALISAVQRWRFRPATVNGEPVSAPYSVQIQFKGHE
jgi:TonB family protein